MHAIRESYPAIRSGALAVLLLGAAASARAQGPSPAPDAPAPAAAAQAAADEKPTMEIYGFGQADAIVDFKQNNPDWYDVNRPSRLPNVANQFGNDGRFYLSVAPEPPGRQRHPADLERRREGAVRVRHVRRRR